ncbi:unnamed protein product [Chrysoparadoxa australica]
METSSSTPFPTRPVVVICLCQLCVTFCTVSILPYVARQSVRLVYGTGVDVDSYLDGIGSYAGILFGTFMMGRITSSIPWGMVSERIGRKPVLMMGLFMLTVLQPVYGITEAFWLAVLTRAMMGFFSAGIPVVVSLLCTELGGKEHESRCNACFIGACCVGGMFVPVVGGALSEPATVYSGTLGDSQLLISKPYLLPSLAGMLLSASTALATYFWLPETLHKGEAWREGDLQKEQQQGQEQEQEQEQEPNEGESLEVEEDGGISSNWRAVLAKPEDRFILKLCRLLSSWYTVGSIVCAGFSALLFMFEESLSLLAVASPAQGGFGWPNHMVGLLLTTAGSIAGLWQFFVLHRAIAWVGVAKLQVILAALAAAASFLVPSLSSIVQGAGDAVLCLVEGCAAACFIICMASIYTTSLVLANQEVSPDLRALLSGLVFTVITVCMSVGSVAAGFASAFGLSEGYPFPFNYFLPFICVSVVSATISVLTWGVLLDGPPTAQASEEDGKVEREVTGLDGSEESTRPALSLPPSSFSSLCATLSPAVSPMSATRPMPPPWEEHQQYV